MSAIATAPQFLESSIVARELGVSVEALRDWERRGLIASPLRTVSGRRLFTREDVEVIRQGRAARKSETARPLTAR